VRVSLYKEEIMDLTQEKPRLNISVKEDEKVNANEQKAFDKEFEREVKDWRLRKKELQNGLEMVFALIKETYCTKSMRDRVEAHPEYESKIKDNPVELLKVIRVLTHETVSAQHSYVSLVDLVAWLMTIKQYDDSLLEY
jgi:hypothetical protein